MTLYRLFQTGSVFLYVVRTAILVYVVMTWINPRGSFFLWLESFIRPFVAPFRRFSVWLMARTRMPLDFSCWFALIGLTFVERIWWWLYSILRVFR